MSINILRNSALFDCTMAQLSQLAKIFILILVLLFCFDNGFAQQNGNPLPRINGEANQMVNLYTGRMSVNLPLAGISGRGASGAGINIISKGIDWQIVETLREYHPTTGHLLAIHYAPMPSYPSNYFDYTPLTISFETDHGFSYVWEASGPMVSYPVVTTSDGNKIYFRDTLREGEPTELNGQPNNGPLVQCTVNYGIQWTPNDPPPLPPPNPPANCLRGKVFHSMDSSGMTFVTDNDVYDAHYATPNDPWGTINYIAHIDQANAVGKGISGYLYLANGTKYRIKGGKATVVTDRNGNQTNFFYSSPPFGGGLTIDCGNESDSLAVCRLSKITDSLNREILINYGDYIDQGYIDTISYKSFGGAEKQVKVYHDPIANAMKNPGDTFQNPVPAVTVNIPQNSNLSNQFNNYLDRYTKKTSGDSNLTTTDPIVISRVTLPDGKDYQFKYNSYGELVRIKTPSGSYTDYTYGPLPNPRVCTNLIETKRTDPNGLTWVKLPWESVELPDAVVRRVTESRVFDKNGTFQNKTTFSDIGAERPVTVAAKDANNLTVQASKHYYMNDLCTDLSRFLSGLQFFNDWRENKEIKTEIYADENASTPLRINEILWEQRAPIPWLSNHPLADAAYASNDPRVKEVKTTLETGQVTKKTYTYDQDNNITDIYDYDYGDGQNWQFLRRSHTDYVTNPSYTSYTGVHLKSLHSQSWVSSDLAGNNKVSLVQYEYDNYSINPLVSRSNVSGHDSVNYGVSKTLRGNITKATSYADAQNQTGAVSGQNQYDILGNIVKTIDARGFINTIDYTDRFGSPDAEARSNNSPAQLNGKNAFAFATSATNPLGYVSYNQFDYNSGLIVDSEDLNENISTTFYNDVLDRPTQVITANNRPSLRRQTTTVYNDLNLMVTTTSDLYSFGDNLAKAEMLYNSLSHIIETRTYETGGYVVTSKPQFDGFGRVVQSTIPYRPYLNELPAWTTTTFDNLGRVTKVKTPDNMEATTSYSGNVTTFFDQAGKKQRSLTNAIGQLIRVDEPNDANDLGDVSNPVQPTYYTYNSAGNLVKVSQGQQNRYFLYDSLNRLIRIRQPEQSANPTLAISDPITGNSEWSAASTYDGNGNILTATEAKGTVITQTYDNLNRPLTKSYSNGTPTVTFEYDNAVVLFSKGQLTKINSSVSTTEYTGFDATGKVLGHKQITDGQTYSTAYTYNLSGGLVEETYPSGRVVKNSFDNDGRLNNVTSKIGSQTDFRHYASNFVYTSSGLISSMRLGNGCWESAQYNSRLQITQIGLGNSQNATNLWKVNYDYGEVDGQGNLKNNGNVASQTINFTGLNQPFIQTYKYDSLNRLTEAKEMNGGTQTWIQTFGFDRYGNRTSFSQQEVGQQPITQTPTVDPTTNRFTTGQGFTYDFNGNLIADNQGHQFTFNGDNKQVEVRDSANNIIGLYYYDGNGNRVKKISVSETTIFVYNAGGKLVAEYSTQQAATATISYLTADALGSPRVITDNSGHVISRRDFMPFGEELTANYANRTESNKYSIAGIDNVRKRFTGFEKDIETGLDFAEARMYDNRLGKFTTVDPFIASGISANPQSFNRYVYVVNNPVNLIDPNGLCGICGRDNMWFSLDQDYFLGISSIVLSPFSNGNPFINALNAVAVSTTSDFFVVQRTTSYQTSAQDGPDYKVDITIIAVELLIVNSSGDLVLGDANPQVASSATNSSRVINGVRSFGDRFNAEKQMIETITATIVKISIQLEFDPAIALGIAKTETQFGVLKSKEYGNPAWKETSVNPMALSGNNAAGPNMADHTKYYSGPLNMSYQDALEYNIIGGIELFKALKGSTLNEQLQNYNNQAGKVSYANAAESTINSISASKRVSNVVLGGFTSKGKLTGVPSVLSLQQCGTFIRCPKIK